MDDSDECSYCVETTIISTISTSRHGGKSQSLRPTPTTTSSQYNLVTVVVQVGLFPSGISILPDSLASLNSTTNFTTTSLALPTPTSLITSPNSTQNLRLVAATATATPSDPTSLNIGEYLQHSKKALGGIIGGLVGLILLVVLLSACASRAKRKRNRDALDMMAPSNLPDAYVRAAKEHRRLSTAWFETSDEKFDGHGYAR